MTDRDEGRADGAHHSMASLIAAVLGFFVVTLDSLVANVVVPSMGRDLGGAMACFQWVIDGYTLMFAALLLSFRSRGCAPARGECE